MPVVGPAAAAEDVQLRKLPAQPPIAGAEIRGVAVIELSRLVELGVALGRRIRPQAANPLAPNPAALQHPLEVRRVGAVDHEVRGARPVSASTVSIASPSALPARQPAVRLDRERDRRRESRVGGRSRDADRLLRVRHRERRDHVGRGVGEGSDLGRVIVAGPSPRRAAPRGCSRRPGVRCSR